MIFPFLIGDVARCHRCRQMLFLGGILPLVVSQSGEVLQLRTVDRGGGFRGCRAESPWRSLLGADDPCVKQLVVEGL